ncbi:MAG: radical SAM protein [Candidatus Omnitrophica bacterium]|nr:radical SAM protein [Candidatus Omnitrophota bacterium]
MSDEATQQAAVDLKKSRLFFQTRFSKLADPNDLIAEVKGERYKEYRRRFLASGRGEMILDYPLDLSVEAVDWCNYECPYCPRAVDRGSKARIDKAAFERMIDEYAARTQGLAAVGFDRGEPLIDKHLEEKVRYIADRGIVDIILTTNGVYLTPERSRKLIEAGVTKLHCSIDAATQDTYTVCRGGDLELVENNLKEFIRVRNAMGRKVPIVRVSFVVTKLNEHEMDLFVRKWADYTDYIEFQDCVDHSRIDTLPDFETGPFHCQYPFQSIAVTANGNIQPCCSFYAKHLVFGNILKGDTVGQVFNSPQQTELRRSFLEKKGYSVVCKNCRMKPPGATRSDAILVKPAYKPSHRSSPFPL